VIFSHKTRRGQALLFIVVDYSFTKNNILPPQFVGLLFLKRLTFSSAFSFFFLAAKYKIRGALAPALFILATEIRAVFSQKQPEFINYTVA